jgi:hypothetical protein
VVVAVVVGGAFVVVVLGTVVVAHNNPNMQPFCGAAPAGTAVRAKAAAPARSPPIRAQAI